MLINHLLRIFVIMAATYAWPISLGGILVVTGSTASIQDAYDDNLINGPANFITKVGGAEGRIFFVDGEISVGDGITATTWTDENVTIQFALAKRLRRFANATMQFGKILNRLDTNDVYRGCTLLFNMPNLASRAFDNTGAGFTKLYACIITDLNHEINGNFKGRAQFRTFSAGEDDIIGCKFTGWDRVEFNSSGRSTLIRSDFSQCNTGMILDRHTFLNNSPIDCRLTSNNIGMDSGPSNTSTVRNMFIKNNSTNVRNQNSGAGTRRVDLINSDYEGPYQNTGSGGNSIIRRQLELNILVIDVNDDPINSAIVDIVPVASSTGFSTTTITTGADGKGTTVPNAITEEIRTSAEVVHTALPFDIDITVSAVKISIDGVFNLNKEYTVTNPLILRYVAPVGAAPGQVENVSIGTTVPGQPKGLIVTSGVPGQPVGVIVSA